MKMPITQRSDLSADDLRRLARRSRDANQARRLLALAAIHDGARRDETARIGGVGRQIIRDWVPRFNAAEPDGLIDRKLPGPTPRLKDDQRRALVTIVEAGPMPSIYGVVRWRLVDLAQRVWDEFHLSVSPDTLSRELRRLGYRRLTARPRHHVQCSHYLVQPVACTPASGWEKGQVENQVGLVRKRFFTPRLRVKNLDEPNAWLLDRCVAYAKARRHPEETGRTIWKVFEAEHPRLVPHAGRFDGFHSVPASLSKTCTVRFDNNKYSVLSTAVGRPVEVHAYAERIVIRQDGVIVAEHVRASGRGQTLYDPWHYVPVLARKPGALRNGAPFRNWVLPPAMASIQRKRRSAEDGDRQMVQILTCVATDGLAAVEVACREALDWSAPIGWSGFNLSAWPASAPWLELPVARVRGGGAGHRRTSGAGGL